MEQEPKGGHSREFSFFTIKRRKSHPTRYFGVTSVERGRHSELLPTIGCVCCLSVCYGLCPVRLGTVMMKRRAAARPTWGGGASCIGLRLSSLLHWRGFHARIVVPIDNRRSRAKTSPVCSCVQQRMKNCAENMLNVLPTEDDHSTANKLRHDAGLPAPLHLHCPLSH